MSTTTHRAGLASTAVSLVAAVLSSACCWAPLLALALGTSAAGFAGTFAPLRPYFLAVAALALGVSAYLLFIKPRHSAPCEGPLACATPRPRLRRFQVLMFALSVLMTSAFAFFPNYAAALTTPSAAIAEQAELPVVTWQVDGMTCKSCASILAESLTELEGIEAAEVDYDTGRARLQLAAQQPASLNAEVEALLDENGFSGHELP